MTWRALVAGVALAVLALLLLGPPVDLDPRFYRVSPRGIGGLARYLIDDYTGTAWAYREELRRSARTGQRIEADPR